MATLFLSLFLLFSFFFKSLNLFFDSLTFLLLHLLKSLSLLLSFFALLFLFVLLLLFVMLLVLVLTNFFVFLIFTVLGLRFDPVLNLRNNTLILFLFLAFTSLLFINFVLLPVSPVFPVSIIPIINVIILFKITPIELFPVVTLPVLGIKLLKPILLVFLTPVLPALRDNITKLLTDLLLAISPLFPGLLIPAAGIVVVEISPIKVKPIITFPVLNIEPDLPGKLVLKIPVFKAPWLITKFLSMSLVNPLLLVLGPFVPFMLVPFVVAVSMETHPVKFLPVILFPFFRVEVIKEIVLV